MRKMLIVAVREYLAAVKTKAFVVSLLILPVMVCVSLSLQWTLRNLADTEPKRFAVVDRSPGGALFPRLAASVQERNEKEIYDRMTGEQNRPVFLIERIEPGLDTPEAVDQQRYELSERVRRGELFGFLEIGPDVFATDLLPPAGPDQPPDPRRERRLIRYQTNRPTDDEFYRRAIAALGPAIRESRAVGFGLSPEQARSLWQPITFIPKGLSQLEHETGAIADATEQDRLAPMVVPSGFMLLMITGMLMGATPLMQGVVEEKMQRIAEVLAASVGPFPLMLGKLLGMTAVSLTIVSLYLAVAFVGAYRFGFADHLTPTIVAWFLVYQVLVVLMYGSLFIAIGAACTNLKETQNLLWPVMLLASLPLFVLWNLLREPNSAAVTGLSFFPFVTPMLMIARQSVPPGVPAWQPFVGLVGVVLTTLACVYAAARIFRVGILMQGQGARMGELVRWVFRG